MVVVQQAAVEGDQLAAHQLRFPLRLMRGTMPVDGQHGDTATARAAAVRVRHTDGLVVSWNRDRAGVCWRVQLTNANLVCMCTKQPACDGTVTLCGENMTKVACFVGSEKVAPASARYFANSYYVGSFNAHSFYITIREWGPRANTAWRVPQGACSLRVLFLRASG